MRWPRIEVSRRASIDRYYLVRTRLGSLFLHRFKRDDRTDTFHSHPWSWVSLILGCYDDHRLDGRLRRRWFVNCCRAGIDHRVTLPHGPVWTLLIHGPRRVNWEVRAADGRLLEVEPWRGMDNIARQEYLEQHEVSS